MVKIISAMPRAGVNTVHTGTVPRSNQAGFTVVELMIGLLLLTILSTTGVPLYRDFIVTQQLRAATADLRIALVTARSEAVKRNRAVSLLPNADGWGDGWRIPDPDDPVDEVLFRHKQSGEIAITGPASVQFTPAGRPALTVNTSFEIAAGGDDSAKACMTISLDGRTTTSEGPCS